MSSLRIPDFKSGSITNREIIAGVDQDPLGKQGFRVAQQDPFEVWMKPMADGARSWVCSTVSAPPSR